MGRPRSVPDARILDAVGRVLERVGPDGLTFADVAKEAGLAPSTLVQRFGSRRGLLLAFARREAANAPELLRRGREDAGSPLDALERGVRTLVGPAADPEVMANQVAFLVMDVSDPGFRALAAEHQRGVRGEIESLLAEAMEEGEIRAGDAERLAATLHALVNGVMITWALDREGSLEERVTREMTHLLEPWRSGPRKRAPAESG